MYLSRIDAFLEKKAGPYRHCPGEYVVFKQMYQDFVKFLNPSERPDWPKKRLRLELSAKHPIGRGPGNRVIIGNISDKNRRSPAPYVLVNGRVVQEN